MKLRTIAEGRTVIRDAAVAIGDLIDYLKGVGGDEWQDMLGFLDAPTARGWEKVKWVIDSAIRSAAGDPKNASRAEKWGSLKELTSPVAASAVYDVEPAAAKGTPLQNVTQSKSVRDKYKLALGPAGYVAAMSSADDIPANKLKDMLRNMSKSGQAIAKSAKEDIPGVRPTARF